jgi:hypothetical protein
MISTLPLYKAKDKIKNTQFIPTSKHTRQILYNIRQVLYNITHKFQISYFRISANKNNVLKIISLMTHIN